MYTLAFTAVYTKVHLIRHLALQVYFRSSKVYYSGIIVHPCQGVLLCSLWGNKRRSFTSLLLSLNQFEVISKSAFCTQVNSLIGI